MKEKKVYCVYVAVLAKKDLQIIQIVEALSKSRSFCVHSSSNSNCNQKQHRCNFLRHLFRMRNCRNIFVTLENNALIIYD